MDARETLGWNLRKRRVERRLSQEALALEAQVDRAYLGRVERGRENVTISTIEQIALALNVTIADLFRLPDEGESPPMPLRAGRRKKQS
ncbi:helix-turn-helix transcriptional regulator [Rhizobium sp. S163]|uniref:helix-turn-helix domain-containing protein n=1 Tax=Rhizobium sp. S163 TaxID=3055039 RepID=UPI0025A9AB9D|nr:helix-turn-helix transcriptional regulator [Rhizobium sp. S163]MDM9647110.1 helix-turn-helix transcriptional regulator [Rhizobium sp. S163]